MRKLWTIGRKDLVVLFRDRAALILMLAAPLALTVGLGIVTGSFSGGGRRGLRAGPLRPPGGTGGPPAAIELVQNPGRPTSAAIIASIVNGYLLQLQAGEVGAQVVISQLVGSGRVPRQEIPLEAPTIGRRLATDTSANSPLRPESDLP